MTASRRQRRFRWGFARRLGSSPRGSAALLTLGMSLGVNVAGLGLTQSAQAGRYDLDLTRLGRLGPGGQSVHRFDGLFRGLASELGTVMAPRPTDTADSLGLAGFSVSAGVGTSTISHQEQFWTRVTSGPPIGAVASLQLMVRKGLWPGLELGAGATKLFGSRMWSMHGYFKAALHEGFHHLPIPSIALKVSAGHLLGARALGLTTIGADVTISHSFGIAKTLHLTPYIGYQALTILAKTGALQTSPERDSYPEGVLNPGSCGGPGRPCPGSEFFFSRQVIVRHRPFVGARFNFGVFRVAIEAMLATPGRSQERVAGRPTRDTAGLQQQYALSMGLDF